MLNAIKRIIVVILGVIFQFGFLILIRIFFKEHFTIISIIYWLISVIIVLSIIRYSTHLSNDLPWIILILIFPILGTILLITLGTSYIKSKLLRNIIKKEKEYLKYYDQDEIIKKEINEKI